VCITVRTRGELLSGREVIMGVMMDTFSQPDTASTTLELEERDLPLLAHAK
jgi:hypothetical protein